MTENVMGTAEMPKKKTSLTSRKRQQTIFLTILLAFPIVQFCIFYIGVNINSIVLAFQRYNPEKATFEIVGIENFIKIFDDIFVNGELKTAVINSLVQFCLTLFISMPINIFVAYLVWRKLPFSGFFKVVLFLPSMVSGVVFVTIARYILTGIMPLEWLLLDMPSGNGFKTVMVYDLWFNIASGMVVYLGAMSNVSDEVLEYGELEGLGTIKEFFYVVIPGIFPTITTYVVASFAGFFTNYGSLFTFFGSNTSEQSIRTLGYYFFVGVTDVTKGSADYPYAAAGGLFFTLIVAPVTLFVKWLLEKYGPSED